MKKALIVGAVVVVAAVIWMVAVSPSAPPAHAPDVGKTPGQTPGPGQEPEPVAVHDGPNVIIVLWDTVRADHMSLYGYEKPTTPKMAKWAERGVVFEQARSPGVWTLPSHASMFTGLPAQSTGSDERWMWLDSYHETVAEHFQKKGYATFSFGANTLLSTETNLTQGFDLVLNTYKGRMKGKARGLTVQKILPEDASNELSAGWSPPEHGAKNAEWARAQFKDAAPLITDTLVRWIDSEKRGDRPFFAYLNLMEAHTPRIPSLKARKQIVGDNKDLFNRMLNTDAGHINLHFYNFGKHEYSSDELEAISAVYDSTLVDLDDATSNLFASLETKGLLENTVVILVADHGENLGDHHLFNHRFALWDSLLHVPLVVWAPGMKPGRESAPVSTTDLFSTVAQLAKMPRPSHLNGGWFDDDRSPAASVMALPLKREIDTVKAVFDDVQPELWLRTGESIVVENKKRIRYSTGAVRTYDLASDPAEAKPDVGASDLDGLLDAWLKAAPVYDPTRRGEQDNPKHVRASQKELRQALQAMGYITEDEEE